MPLIIRQQIRRAPQVKNRDSHLLHLSDISLYCGSGWVVGGETKVNKVGIEREDYLSSAKKTDLNQYFMILSTCYQTELKKIY